MATYSKLPSGTWRVQVRRKGRYISETFLKRDDARRWATEAEGRIDRGEVPTPSRSARLRTFGELVDLHIEDMKSVGKAPRRSKAATLKMLKARLGGKKIAQLDRQLFIDFGRGRATEGAGPMTLGIDIGAIKLILSHAAAVHGLTLPLGSLRYVAAATPDFRSRYFPDGVTAEHLAEAPVLRFSPRDRLQLKWTEMVVGRTVEGPTHWVPSTQGFLDFTLAGVCWSLTPERLAAPLMASGRLIDLHPGMMVDVPLFWQHLRITTRLIDDLTRAVRSEAGCWLASS